MNVGLEHYLVVSIILFCLGLLGVIMRRNLLVIYMSLELMLNAANLVLVAFSRFTNNLDGQVFVFFIITVAAAEGTMSARPTDTSAAATVMMKKTNTWPSRLLVKRENATNTRFAALSISSRLM